MAKTTEFTWTRPEAGTCKWHKAGACRHVGGAITMGMRYTWDRSATAETPADDRHWHIDCPTDEACPTITVRYACKCAKCHADLEVGTLAKWRSASKELWHVECPSAQSTIDACHSTLEQTLEASLARVQATRAAEALISAPIAPVEVPKREAAPTVPAPIDAASTIEAAIRAIAASVAPAPSVTPLDEDRVIALIQAHSPVAVTRVEVVANGVSQGAIDGQHKNFAALLQRCSARTPDGKRLNIWLAGPAGTGKTTAARKVAEALALAFYSMGSVQDPTQLIGYVSPVTTTYMTTPFRRAFEGGGVMLLDEIDGSDPNALLVLNQALANTHMMFPDGQLIERHNDFVCVCAANTYGLGGTHDYVGRMKQDAAFLDRFVACDWPIDEDLETRLTGNAKWSKHVQKLRANAVNKGLRVVISPRASIYGAALLSAGVSWGDCEAATIRKGLTAEQWESIQ